MSRRPHDHEPSLDPHDLDDPTPLEVRRRAPSHRPGRPARRGGGVVPWFLVALLLVGGVVAYVMIVHPMGAQLGDTRRMLTDAAGTVATLQEQVGRLDAARRQAEMERDALAEQVEHREKVLEAVQAAEEELARKLAEEVDRGNVLIRQTEGELVVDLIDQILFDSGEATLNAQGKEVLKGIAETLAKVPGQMIEVRGHTDPVPIASKLKGAYPSNWELSTARATNVVRFLQDGCSIPGHRLVAAGYAEFRPTADNKSKLGRKRNRRIEVVLLPTRTVHLSPAGGQ